MSSLLKIVTLMVVLASVVGAQKSCSAGVLDEQSCRLSVIGDVGSDVSMMCIVPPPYICRRKLMATTVEWLRNDQTIVAGDPSLILEQSNTTLTIVNMTKQRNGVYKCIIKDYAIHVYSVNCRCSLTVAEKFRNGCYILDSTIFGIFNVSAMKRNKQPGLTRWTQEAIWHEEQDSQPAIVYPIPALGLVYTRILNDERPAVYELSQVLPDEDSRDPFILTCPIVGIVPADQIKWIVHEFMALEGKPGLFPNEVKNVRYISRVRLRRWTATLTNMSANVVGVSCQIPRNNPKYDDFTKYIWMNIPRGNITLEYDNPMKILHDSNNRPNVVLLRPVVTSDREVTVCAPFFVKGNTIFEHLHVQLDFLPLNVTVEYVTGLIVNSSPSSPEEWSAIMLKRWHPFDWFTSNFSLPIKPCYFVTSILNPYDKVVNRIAPSDGLFIWQVRHLTEQVPVWGLQRVILTDDDILLVSSVSPSPLGLEGGRQMAILLYVLFGIVLIGAILIVAKALHRGRHLIVRRQQKADSMEMMQLSADLVCVDNPMYHHWSRRGWDIPRDKLVLGEVIGRGEFGIVYKATIRTGSSDTTVAVKTHKEEAAFSARATLESELEILKKVAADGHPNILQLVGSSIEGSQLFVVTEYAERGSLKTILDWICREVGYSILRGNSIQHKVLDLLYFAHHVASGMAFLESKKIVHSDLATRNILVTAENVLKIADFGMTGEAEYYHRCNQGMLPVKWMAPESLSDRKFTTKSDRWAFGIVLWEIFSLGASPYPTLQLPQMFEIMLLSLRQGKRMGKPRNAPEEIYQLMLSCWHYQPSQRPSFQELCFIIDGISDNMNPETKLLAPLSPMCEGRLVLPKKRSRPTNGESSLLWSNRERHGSLDRLVGPSKSGRLVRSHSLGSLASTGLLSQSSIGACGYTRSPAPAPAPAELNYVTEFANDNGYFDPQ